jgi:hypothetical protein
VTTRGTVGGAGTGVDYFVGGPVSQDVVTVGTSRAAIELHWAASEVFDVLGAWASESDNPSVAVSMATTSRHLSWHVADLAELIADSETESETSSGSGAESETGEEVDDEPSAELHPDVAAALGSIRDIPGTVPRLGVAHRVLVPRLAVGCVLIERTAKPDAEPDPVATIAGAMLADLRRDRDDGEVLLTKLLHDIATVGRVGERVLEAERHLVAVGGLVPAAPT